MTLAGTWDGLGNQNVLKNAPQTVEVKANGCTGKELLVVKDPGQWITL